MHEDIVDLCDRQYAVFARWQAMGAGVSEHNLDSLLRSGRVLRISRGVYRSASAPLTPDAWLVVERDGKATHSGPEARERDSSNTTALQALGLAVKRITAEHVRHPTVLRREIEALLEVLGGRGIPFTPDGSARASWPAGFSP